MSTFEDKVLEYIKNGGGGLSVGMCIRLANGVSVPSTGTWELNHWVDFLGTSIIDSVRSKETIASEANWHYDNLLGSENYHISTTFVTYLNESDPTKATYTKEFNLNNGTTTYNVKQTSSSMTISNTNNEGINCAVRVLIRDISKVSVSDDNLSFEYQSTA